MHLFTCVVHKIPLDRVSKIDYSIKKKISHEIQTIRFRKALHEAVPTPSFSAPPLFSLQRNRVFNNRSCWGMDVGSYATCCLLTCRPRSESPPLALPVAGPPAERRKNLSSGNKVSFVAQDARRPRRSELAAVAAEKRRERRPMKAPASWR